MSTKPGQAHNLGLVHSPPKSFTHYVPFGHGYRHLHTTTIMDFTGGRVHHFSTPDLLHGRVIGNAEVSDSVRALRYTIPDATRYSPTVVREPQDDPEDFGCPPAAYTACLNNWRFRVQAIYSTPTVEHTQVARKLETFGLGDSASLFYFFEPNNPELLVKVVNGC